MAHAGYRGWVHAALLGDGSVSFCRWASRLPSTRASTNSPAGGRGHQKLRALHCGDNKSETLGSEWRGGQSSYQLQYSPRDSIGEGKANRLLAVTLDFVTGHIFH